MSMQLCLVNNDPTSTTLVTPDGIPLFSIETPHFPASSIDSPLPRQKPPTGTTTIKRLERYHMSTGHVETEIGIIVYHGQKGCHLELSALNHSLDVTPYQRTPAVIREKVDATHKEDIEEVDAVNSWEFTHPGSDERYKWQMFAHTPVMISSTNSVTPIARYRRAKLGIVSRSRRAFLEIFPAGLAIIDFIVVTFVAFMKQRILIDNPENLPSDVIRHPSQTSSPAPRPPSLFPSVSASFSTCNQTFLP
ncbi:hypothetical protein BDN70DRAFT_930959 [Pholiota conissans]|uniref:DUF6593 domain-containing protein n=1 Tax=Pholiota conissans TaxID=109636 RepID=A0A9P6CV42_9AGAR|nr:hypothetical protein BDN70DRAFT_930959 [Pholiota conissans]